MLKAKEVENGSHAKKNNSLKQIYFYLTEGCNLACRHCWLSPKLQDEDTTHPSLSPKLFNTIIEQAKPLGLQAVKLTGGEPLMHPQISQIIKIIKDQDLLLTMETNGVLCNPGLAQELASCKKAFVAVSLDGADAETHEWVRGIKGCFDAALKGIRNFVKAGIRTQIIITVMNQNKGQFADLVRLAESLRVGSVKFNLVQPTGRGKTLSNEGKALLPEELIELGAFVNNTLSATTKLKLHYDLPAAFRPLSSMFGENGDGCATCAVLDIIGVLSNGDYALCGIGSHVPELVFGNASKCQLEDVWSTHPVLKELREGIPSCFKGICGSCHMKRMCNASCIAQNYYRSKDLWKPFWFCDEAHRQGIFPKSRIAPQTTMQSLR